MFQGKAEFHARVPSRKRENSKINTKRNETETSTCRDISRDCDVVADI
jgi:hypothetical protein